MNAIRWSAAAVALSFAGAAAGKPEAPVPVNTQGLAPHVAQRVQEKARLGATQLRLYLQRTRMIHGLYWGDIVLRD